MTWDQYYYDLMAVVRNKSKDESTQVAAIIVGPNNEVRSMGFNGLPRGVDDDKEKHPERHFERPEKYHWYEHGERNAIYNAARIGTAIGGCKLYVTGYPCTDCARAIIQSGITEVIIGNFDTPEFLERWKEKNAKALTMFKEAGIPYRIIDGKSTT